MSMPVPSFKCARQLAVLTLSLTLTVAPEARAQVAGLTGTLVVTNKTPSTATIVDVASGRTLATLPTAPPARNRPLVDGALAVTTDYGGPRRTLTVIDVPALVSRAPSTSASTVRRTVSPSCLAIASSP